MRSCAGPNDTHRCTVREHSILSQAASVTKDVRSSVQSPAHEIHIHVAALWCNVAEWRQRTMLKWLFAGRCCSEMVCSHSDHQ